MADNVRPSLYRSHDIDFEGTFEAVYKSISTGDASNFAVYFNQAKASCAINLDEDGLIAWSKDHDASLGTRWLHFWVDEEQAPLLAHLAKEYDVTPRLLGFLCPTGKARQIDSSSGLQDSPDPTQSHEDKSASSDAEDVEKAAAVQGNTKMHSKPTQSALEDVQVIDIVSDLWHFCSIDWGHRYVYAGVNVLSTVPGISQPVASDKPAAQRLWTSLLLCDDGTVISTSERPCRYADEKTRLTSVRVARRHVCNVLRHLSRVDKEARDKTRGLTNVKIRPDSGSSTASNESSNGSDRLESSSLLFYYVFDDWMTTYALIARKEHPYRARLERVRQDMIKASDVKLLETLHSIGRQLTILKLVYESYAQVISRLLDRYYIMASNGTQTYTNDPIRGSNLSRNGHMATDRLLSSHSQGVWPTQLAQHSYASMGSMVTNTKLQMSMLAIARFERLLDRIHLYALNEIENCLNEKESLVLMTFNLLALSESRSIEKLTRTTILLAKATILFLPMSLQTAYFSIQVGSIQETYTLKTYWVSFSVVAILSIAFLLLFGLKTGTVEGKSYYRNMYRLLWQKGITATTGALKAKRG